jgi:hypothetical protein
VFLWLLSKVVLCSVLSSAGLGTTHSVTRDPSRDILKRAKKGFSDNCVVVHFDHTWLNKELRDNKLYI